LLPALALFSLHIPYLVHAEKQYQCKDSQLNPHAHGCTFLKAYKYYTSTYAQPGSAWRPEIYHQVVQVLSDNAAKNAKKIGPKADSFFGNRGCRTK